MKEDVLEGRAVEVEVDFEANLRQEGRELTVDNSRFQGEPVACIISDPVVSRRPEELTAQRPPQPHSVPSPQLSPSPDEATTN